MPKNKKYKMKPMPMPYTEDAMEEFKMKPMPYIEGSIEEPRMKPMPYYEDDDMGLEAAAQEAVGRKKGGMTKGQKKVGKVMSEFKAGKLKSSSGKKVTNPKQAIAIGLSEAGMSKKKKMGGGMMSDESFQYSKGGMVRGQGIAIKGTKFKGIF